MRKRRKLANKMTIMVFAVLIAVSAFLYAPMEVKASSSVIPVFNRDIVIPNSNGFYQAQFINLSHIFINSDSEFFSDIVLDEDYLVEYDYTIKFNSDSNFGVSSATFRYRGDNLFMFSESKSGSNSYTVTGSGHIFGSGSLLTVSRGCYFVGYFSNSSYSSISVNVDISYSIRNVIQLTGEESSSYQQGYNAGYSAGEEVGESNGYSSGYSDGYEAGEQSGYDSGFQAGSDSVDTQSYYDAGYSAGYDAGYSSGYDTGYDEGYDAGWSAYEEQIDKWGADTSEYPLEISSGNSNAYFSVHVGSDIPFNYRDSDHWFSSNDYNPNHTYKYVINFSNVDEGLDSDILYEYWDIYLNIGGIEYNITPFQDMSVSVFIPGDRISTSYSFDWVLYNCANYVADDSNLAYLYVDYDFVIYDMGPSGNTQNHIANQTDQLTNGYDDSKGNQVNSDLSTGLNDYETAENSLFATAITGMRDFTFFDFESVPAMITGMSFIGSIMGSWFNQAGGASGVGIVLSILFSVILVAMVLGLYRWYQSRGGKN